MSYRMYSTPAENSSGRFQAANSANDDVTIPNQQNRFYSSSGSGGSGSGGSLGSDGNSVSRPSHTRRLGTIRNLGKPQRLGFSVEKKSGNPDCKPSRDDLKSVRRLQTIDSLDDGDDDFKPLRERNPSSNLTSEFNKTNNKSSILSRINLSPAPELPKPPNLTNHQGYPKPTQLREQPPIKEPFKQQNPSIQQPSTSQQQLNRRPPQMSGTPMPQNNPSRTPQQQKNPMRNNYNSMMTPLQNPMRTPQQQQPPMQNLQCNAQNNSLFATPMQTPMESNKKCILVNNKAYTVLKLIGKGGSSKVYEVYDEKSQLRAIKKVDLSDTDEEVRSGYLNEINMLNRLQKYERIVKMYDYEYRKDEDLLFVVMERGDTDLSTVLKTHVTDSKIKFYWEEMLHVVNVIHKAGIIHSDLKPANFLLVAGMLKLIDFGIASSVQSDSTSVLKDSQAGTFNFMSPEAISDLNHGGSNRPKIKISRKSDVWSLGCILYSLTYGRTPFADQRQPWIKLQAIVNPEHKIKYPETPGKDPNLINSINKCLVRNVPQRATINELLNHPYLNPGTSANSIPPVMPQNMDQLLSMVAGALPLTPNTQEGLRRAQRKLRPQGQKLDFN